ncbi:MAG: hypothetical protein FWD15_03425 [Alphaproteobacteria bacterium]|nr:hypothetical protein [Alphaproteobacteria bacterium]
MILAEQIKTAAAIKTHTVIKIDRHTDKGHEKVDVQLEMCPKFLEHFNMLQSLTPGRDPSDQMDIVRSSLCWDQDRKTTPVPGKCPPPGCNCKYMEASIIDLLRQKPRA